jgi:hypothetical protein
MWAEKRKPLVIARSEAVPDVIREAISIEPLNWHEIASSLRSSQ